MKPIAHPRTLSNRPCGEHAHRHGAASRPPAHAFRGALPVRSGQL